MANSADGSAFSDRRVLMVKGRTLVVKVADIQGHCPAFTLGDKFTIQEGYLLAVETSICMHALQALAPYYVALSRGVQPADLGLAGPDGAAYVQCLDPQGWTGGGTVTFRVKAKPIRGAKVKDSCSE